MAEQLEARWFDAPDTRRYALPIEVLTRGQLAMLPGVEAIRLVTAALEPALRAAGHEPRLGKIVSGRGGCESGLYFDHGFAEGAVISLACPPVASEVTVLVGRSSRLLRGAVWGGGIAGCVLGWLGAHALFPGWEFRALLVCTLVGGLAVLIGGLFAAPRIPFFAGGSSGELADALHDVVVDRIDGVEPKRKKRKTRRKKQAAQPEPGRTDP